LLGGGVSKGLKALAGGSTVGGWKRGGVNVDPESDLQDRTFYCCGGGCRPRFGVVDWGVLLVGYAKSLVKQLLVRE